LRKSGFDRKGLKVSEHALDARQTASDAQFDRQSDRYGKSHSLADTRDVAMGLIDWWWPRLTLLASKE
jgi:hypothetical protein